jgi:hypothetical protein
MANDKSHRMWKEMTVACFKPVSWHFSERTKKTHKKTSEKEVYGRRFGPGTLALMMNFILIRLNNRVLESLNLCFKRGQKSIFPS